MLPQRILYRSGIVAAIGSLWEWEWGSLRMVCPILGYAIVSRSLIPPLPIYIFHRWMASAIQHLLWIPTHSSCALFHLPTCVSCDGTMPVCRFPFLRALRGRHLLHVLAALCVCVPGTLLFHVCFFRCSSWCSFSSWVCLLSVDPSRASCSHAVRHCAGPPAP